MVKKVGGSTAVRDLVDQIRGCLPMWSTLLGIRARLYHVQLTACCLPEPLLKEREKRDEGDKKTNHERACARILINNNHQY